MTKKTFLITLKLKWWARSEDESLFRVVQFLSRYLKFGCFRNKFGCIPPNPLTLNLSVFFLVVVRVIKAKSAKLFSKV